MTVWVTCSYDGSCLVNQGIFADWLDAPNYGNVAKAKLMVVENLFNIKLTQAHTGTIILLPAFADTVRSCFAKQAERGRIQSKANDILMLSIRVPGVHSEEVVLNAEKTLAELETNLT